MNFGNIYEAKRWFLDYKELDKQTGDSIINFWYNYDFKDWKFGDYILFQHVEDGRKIGRPQYAIFTSFTVWDQSLVMQFVQNKRAWMNSTTISSNRKGFIESHVISICMLDDEVEKIQFWTDNIHVLGHWKFKPSASELKSALKNIIVPLKEAREDKLKDILK